MEKEHNQHANTTVRIEWLDIAKGLGVFFVVIGHLWYNCALPVVNQIIYSFHMPLFFILSGFVFKKGGSGFGSFLMGKVKRLLVPTFLFFVLGTVPLFLAKQPIATIISKFFFFEGLCPFNDPCWYFIVLFQLSVIAYFLNLDKLSLLCKGIVALLSFIIGLAVYKLDIFIPFGIDRTIIALVFFVFGSILRQAYDKKLQFQSKLFNVLISIVLMAIWILTGVILNGRVSLYTMDIGNIFPYVISGISGSILAIAFSKLLQKTKLLKRFLSKTADNSILIVGTHCFVIYIFEKVMGHFGLFGTWQYSLIVIGFSIVTILIYNSVGTLFKKHLPAITGDMR